MTLRHNWKKVFCQFLALLLFAGSAFSQVKIDGRVRDKRGRAIPGASITIKDSYDGSTTDSTGYFKFTTMEKGKQLITISTIGYVGSEQEINISGPLTLNFSLKEKLDELKAVMVTAGSFEAGDRKRAATVLSSLDVATTGGANADITSAVKTLPGAQQVGEKEGLFVRGGTGAETKQFIDGTMVNNPYMTSAPDISARGRFSPFLFKGTVFSTGGYSALYGQALSSALILE
ncbi:MAG TPA: carboxypeptidase-like regulatory domain-containing protein, partial [Flavitalea sp.]|nr:carboxypeptidase-like regulatory domain-containing protein [Flavitalea sp.]